MQELIRVTQTEQGSQVVSARELYAFLEVKARFNDWFKRRVIKYGFQEGADFVELEGVLLKSEYNPGGRPETDYALTLDMAKQLSMVENNQQGQQARRYFIDCEKKLTRLAAQPPQITATDPALLQLLASMQQQQVVISTQLATMAARLDQREQIDRLREDVRQIQDGRKPARQLPPVAGSPIATGTLRQAVNRKVNAYCGIHDASQQDTYTYLYRLMHLNYGINVHRLARQKGESYIDAIERHGYLDRLYKVACGLIELPYE